MNLGFERPYRFGKCVGEFFGNHPKLRFAMKVSFFYVVSIALAAQAFAALPAFSQRLDEIQVTVELHNEDLVSLFSKIEGQTRLMFAYQRDQMDSTKIISLPKSTRSVKEFLDIAFQGTSLRYRQSLYSVIIYQERNEPINPLATITGTVTDKAGTTMPGVSIYIKGSSTGTVTDNEGHYSIEAGEGDVLVFTFIGYKKVEEPVGSRILIDLTMEEEINTLKEVVISGGYYETTDKLKTGSIVKVMAKDIERQPVTSPLMALQGRVAGLDIIPNTGAPGSAANIVIRGENSLGLKMGAGRGYPLYIIDGVVIDSRPLQTGTGGGSFYGLGENGTGGIDPLANLNPNNIESFQVLKDADATSIYGSRGANGVIIITTKKAKKGEQLSVDVSYYQGAAKIAKQADLLNTAQYIEMREEAFANNNLSPGFDDYDVNGTWDKSRQTDWQKVLLGGTAHITDAQINLSAGSARTSFRLGGGFHKETTIYPGDFGLKRGSGNFSLSHTSASEKLKVDFSINYGVIKQNMFSSNLESLAFQLAPNAPTLYNSNGTLNWQPINNNGIVSKTFENPLAGTLQTFDATTKNLTASGVISYTIIPDLSIKANIGLTDTNGDEMSTFPIASQFAEPGVTLTGSSDFGRNARSSWITEPQLTYSKKLNDHSLNVVLGTSFQQNDSKRSAIKAGGYKSDKLLNTLKGATSYTAVEDTKIQYRYAAVFARVGYNYKDKYLLNLTGRRDGSSRFAPGSQFGNFGAVGAGWIFTNENFMKALSGAEGWVNFGKLRASYGTTGSDQIGDYSFYNLYRISPSEYQGQVVLQPSALFNNNFQWEVTRKLEGALELGLLQGRITIETAWYRNRSSNQLIYYVLPSATGFGSVFKNFDATVENRGWEFAVTTENISKADVSWSTSFNLTLPKNKLISFPGIEDSPYKDIYKVGEPLTIMKRYIWEGVDPVTGKHKIKDLNNDGFFNTDDQVFSFPTDRKLYGGISNTVRIKSFELSFLVQFSTRYQRQFLVASNPGLFGARVGSNQPVSVLNRWRTEGDETYIARYSTNISDNEFYSTIVAGNSDYRVDQIYFFRIKSASLSYSLPLKVTEKLRMDYVKIYLQAQNLFTVTNYEGPDPDVVSVATSTQLRMLTAGVQLKF